MDSILPAEHNADVVLDQLEAFPFQFVQDFGQTVDASVIDPVYSFQDSHCPADSIGSSSHVTDNGLLIQPDHDFASDMQTQSVPGMQNDGFSNDFSQLAPFQDAFVTPSVSGDVMGLHSNATTSLVDPYSNAAQMFDINDPLISPPEQRALCPNSQGSVPVTNTLMCGRKAATAAYQCHQFAPMTYTISHSSESPYFDATYADRGYCMQPGPYSSMSANAGSMVNVNIQLPWDQTFPNGLPGQQQAVACPSYSYSCPTAAVSPFLPDENMGFASQGFFSEHSMPSSHPRIPPMFNYQRSSPCNSVFPFVGEGCVSTSQANPQQLPFSSVVRSKGKDSYTVKRSKDVPYLKVSPASPVRPTVHKSESILFPDGVFTCSWGGCQQQLVDVNRATFKKHLATHGVRTFGQVQTRCEWVDSKSGKMCGKVLQMQSVIKHICGRAHLDLMSKRCPFCQLHQAMESNMHRHWLTCSVYAEFDEEEQKRLWSKYSKKPFDWYTEQREGDK